MYLHNGVLARLAPEFAITPAEGAELATAVTNYTRHTPARINAKHQDFVLLLMTIFAVEGTRLVRVSSRRKVDRAHHAAEAAARAQAASNVVQMETGVRGI